MSAYSREATYIKLTRPALKRAAERLRPARVRINRVPGYGRTYRVLGRGGAYIVTLASPKADLELAHCSCPAKVTCRHMSAAVIFEAGIESARKGVA